MGEIIGTNEFLEQLSQKDEDDFSGIAVSHHEVAPLTPFVSRKTTEESAPVASRFSVFVPPTVIKELIDVRDRDKISQAAEALIKKSMSVDYDGFLSSIRSEYIKIRQTFYVNVKRLYLTKGSTRKNIHEEREILKSNISKTIDLLLVYELVVKRLHLNEFEFYDIAEYCNHLSAHEIGDLVMARAARTKSEITCPVCGEKNHVSILDFSPLISEHTPSYALTLHNRIVYSCFHCSYYDIAALTVVKPEESDILPVLVLNNDDDEVINRYAVMPPFIEGKISPSSLDKFYIATDDTPTEDIFAAYKTLIGTNYMVRPNKKQHIGGQTLGIMENTDGKIVTGVSVSRELQSYVEIIISYTEKPKK